MDVFIQRACKMCYKQLFLFSPFKHCIIHCKNKQTNCGCQYLIFTMKNMVANFYILQDLNRQKKHNEKKTSEPYISLTTKRNNSISLKY